MKPSKLSSGNFVVKVSPKFGSWLISFIIRGMSYLRRRVVTKPPAAGIRSISLIIRIKLVPLIT